MSVPGDGRLWLTLRLAGAWRVLEEEVAEADAEDVDVADDDAEEDMDEMERAAVDVGYASRSLIVAGAFEVIVRSRAQRRGQRAARADGRWPRCRSSNGSEGRAVVLLYLQLGHCPIRAPSSLRWPSTPPTDPTSSP